MNGAGWINDLTPAQVDLAYGSGNGQIGLSILRMRIDPSSSGWATQVPTATRVHALGGLVFATPWTPPAYMKSNNSLVNGGKLLTNYYGAYTQHLLDFANYIHPAQLRADQRKRRSEQARLCDVAVRALRAARVGAGRRHRAPV